MSFCSNCGTSLKIDSKFCPNCGQKTTFVSKKKKDNPTKMDKGVVKSLKNTVSDNIKNKIDETMRPHSISEKNVFKQPKLHSNINSAKTSKSKKLMLYYFIMNLVLYFFSSGSDEINGVLIFTGIIILLYLIRMSNDKPISIVIKIFLVLQSILMLATIMTTIEFVGDSLLSLLSIPILIALIILSIKLILSGNKKI